MLTVQVEALQIKECVCAQLSNPKYVKAIKYRNILLVWSASPGVLTFEDVFFYLFGVCARVWGWCYFMHPGCDSSYDFLFFLFFFHSSLYIVLICFIVLVMCCIIDFCSWFSVAVLGSSTALWWRIKYKYCLWSMVLDLTIGEKKSNVTHLESHNYTCVIVRLFRHSSTLR